MSITLSCACGRSLRVNDDLVGRKVRCPACQAVLTVPTDAIEEVPAQKLRAGAPPPPVPRRAKKVDEDRKRPREFAPHDWDDDDDDEDDGPRRKSSGRDRDDDDDDDRPRKKSKPRTTNRSSSRIFNSATVTGLLLMVGSFLWFIFSLMVLHRINVYMVVLFVVGVVSLVRGLWGEEHA